MILFSLEQKSETLFIWIGHVKVVEVLLDLPSRWSPTEALNRLGFQPLGKRRLPSLWYYPQILRFGEIDFDFNIRYSIDTITVFINITLETVVIYICGVFERIGEADISFSICP